MFKTFSCRLLVLLIAYQINSSHAIGVIGGVKTTITDHPYVVSLQLANGTHVCGGALIKENIVVTAAQCFVFQDPVQLYVRLGTGSYAADGELISISSYIINENFDFTTMDSDVAVLKLSKSVAKSPAKSEIKVAGEKPKKNRSGVVTSWSRSRQLEDVTVRIIKAKKCRSGEYIYDEDDITDNMFCAQAYNRYICDGEPGSPLVYKKKLIGLVSWGYGCGNVGNPAVYTNVYKLRKWIKKMIKKL
ncbi:PREDICTED: trypsin-like [Bactrocera latifrons]|uniref:Trypsin n=1 Tax=Bactrocera latifrons TaxID=174628 RepID=A0A0K8WGU1_BACLA|nr:PREDICTED: trypsin-like [Bactrocera latifrons]